MTKGKLIYWGSTGLLCLLYASGALAYLFQRPMVEEGFAFFGFPSWLITLLIVVKIAGPLAILTRVSVWLSDLAYAGMLFHLILAVTAHLSVRDPGFGPALFGLALLGVSFLGQNLARKVPSPNVPARFSKGAQALRTGATS